jgi:hypothetical protein
MTGEERTERREKHRHRHGGAYMFIPAGILIGLGVGLLVSHPASGVLVGLGLGFIGTALARVKTPLVSENSAGNQNDYYRRSSPVLFGVLGIFLICLGIGIVWVPAGFWPVMAAAFLILLGVWILYRGFAAAQG